MPSVFSKLHWNQERASKRVEVVCVQSHGCMTCSNRKPGPSRGAFQAGLNYGGQVHKVLQSSYKLRRAWWFFNLLISQADFPLALLEVDFSSCLSLVFSCMFFSFLCLYFSPLGRTSSSI